MWIAQRNIKSQFLNHVQLFKSENLILGRIKQGWIENWMNDLNIEYFTAGDREDRGQAPEYKVPGTYWSKGFITLGVLDGTGMCILDFSNMYVFEWILEKHLIFLVKLMLS